ncbi:MAG: nucleotidyltransferase family protein [Thermaerobacter sp.]|nr:nucleotidyltransferase family protein [Thermaerobacter sp.]
MIPLELEPYRDAILSLAAQHGAERIRLFGSMARGEARPDSDVDFLVIMKPDRTMLDRLALQRDLEQLLHRRVDVVSERGLSPVMHDTVLSEAVPL